MNPNPETAADQREPWQRVADAIEHSGGENMVSGARALADVIGALAGRETDGGVTLSVAQLHLALGYAAFLERTFLRGMAVIREAVEASATSGGEVPAVTPAEPSADEQWVEVTPVENASGDGWAVIVTSAAGDLHEVDAYATRNEAIAASLRWDLPVYFVTEALRVREDG